MPKPARYEAADGTVTWRVRFRIDGRSRSKTFDTKAAGDRFCALVDAVGPARALAVIQETTADDALSHTVRDLAERWTEWKGVRRKDGTPVRVRSSYTLYRYGQIIRNQILPHLGDRPANLVSEGDIQDWIDTLAEDYSAKTCADAHSVLHQIYKWATNKSQGLAVNDPCTETTLPKKRKNVAKGLWPAEWAILHRAAVEVDQDAADLLEFLVASGYRFSEAVAIRVQDVEDYGPDGLFVTMGRVLRREEGGRYAYIEDEGKSAAAMRRTKMSPGAAAMIRRRIAGKGPDDLVLTNRHGRRWNYNKFHAGYWARPVNGRDAYPNRDRIPEVAARMGLTKKVTPHMLRHTHVALMLVAGEPMAAIQKRLGHEDIRTTVGTYGSLVSDVSDRGLDLLDAALSGRPLPQEPTELDPAGA